MSQLDEAQWFDDWYVTQAEADRRGTEWVLWGLGEGPDMGKVEANGALWFLGEYDRARSLWQAFADQ